MVASSAISHELMYQIRRLLFSMHEDQKGQAILRELMIDKFIAANDKWYDSIRKINRELASLEK
jgi:phosphonate transport system substrate-binding protein